MPTSRPLPLDVTIQAQILELMNGLRKRLNTAVMLITHDLGVVAQTCDRVMVMYAGRVIEQGTVREIFREPRHPYTKALLESIPRRGSRRADGKLPTIPGIVPSLTELPPGCRFEARCSYSDRDDAGRCVHDEPELRSIDHGRAVRCHYPIGTPDERPAKLSVSAVAAQAAAAEADRIAAERDATEHAGGGA